MFKSLSEMTDREVWEMYQATKNKKVMCRSLHVTGRTLDKRFDAIGIKARKTFWTEEEIRSIRDYYSNTPPDLFKIENLAKSIGRSVDSVYLKAGRLGYGNSARQKNGSIRRAPPQLELPWRRWIKNEHPRGMKGKKHNAETIATISADSKKRWKEYKSNGTGLMSPEARLARSIKCSIGQSRLIRLGGGKNTYSRCKRGYREDIGEFYFRSAWEANIARYLNWLKAAGKLHRWEYESETFWFEKIRRGVRSYTPDFKVWDTLTSEPYFIEVKGWMDAKSKVKLKRMKKYHPGVRVDLLDQKRYEGIKRTISPLIPNWE